jgi:hypothetical protein
MEFPLELLVLKLYLGQPSLKLLHLIYVGSGFLRALDRKGGELAFDSVIA